MKKINNKGFVLAETLIVTVFVMTIFTMLYVNFFPLLGEYSKREFYDDIDSKYDSYWFKRMIQNPIFFSDSTFETKIDEIERNLYAEITCDDFESDYVDICKEYTNLIVDQDENGKPMITILLTNYAIGLNNNPEVSFKHKIEQDAKSNDPKFSANFQEYISYLPAFALNESPNGAQYRIIIEFKRKIDINATGKDNLYHTYSTIEILRDVNVTSVGGDGGD